MIPIGSKINIDEFYVDENSPDSDHKAIVTFLSLEVIVTPTVSITLVVTPVVTVAPTVSLTPSLIPNDTVVPSPSVTIVDDHNVIDLNNDDEISILDFLEFVEYNKKSDCKIDFNKNNNCQDLEDFQIFVAEYKKSRV